MKLHAFVLPLLCGLLATAQGCGFKSHKYSIAVRNDSNQPIVVGLAKEGEPFEDNWASPEQIAKLPIRPD